MLIECLISVAGPTVIGPHCESGLMATLLVQALVALQVSRTLALLSLLLTHLVSSRISRL